MKAIHVRYFCGALLDLTFRFHSLSLLTIPTTRYLGIVATASAFGPSSFSPRRRQYPHRNTNIGSSETANTHPCPSNNKGRTFANGKLSSSVENMVEAETVTPPVARREEDRAVYAGVAPDGWDPEMPRQANESTEELLDPPVAVKDPYGWLRDDERESKEVYQHLEEENAYSQKITGHLKELQDKLYKEFLSSIRETDYTTPRPRGHYYYYSRTFEGKSYRQYCRAPKTSEGYGAIDWDGTAESPILSGEEVYLDENVLAIDKPYCSIGAASPSPSQKFLAYSVDYSGDEKYQMYVRNLETGEDTPIKPIGGDGDELVETSGDLEWGGDDSTLYYTTMDDQHRPHRLYQRRNWDSPTDATEALLKEESDDLYWCGVGKSLDGAHIFFEAASSETSEIWYLPTVEESTTTEMKCIAPRRNKVLYEVEHGHGQWWIWTNVDESPNMKLMTAPATADSAGDWTLVKDADETIVFDGSLAKALDSVTVLSSHVVMEGREEGIPRVWIYSIDSKSVQRLEFEEAAHDVGLGTNYEFDTKSVAIMYDSLLTPPQSLEISLENPSEADRTVLKEKVVPDYQKDLYGCDRLEILSRDGKTKIPISVVYQKSTMEKVKNGGRAPVHLYGYGSYGSCCEADFDSTRLPLLERGMIYVIAHVRGGGEMGRQWYEEPNGAKYLCKKNTFNDFVDVARFLVAEWTTPDLLTCEGRSAGGLLIGASINQAPELFKVAILGVPFVDVVPTMIDSTIPLTSGEWVEWGNPNEKKYFQYMMEYSPINTVKSGVTYPSCWLTGGLHDPRVQYWEPAKFAATLRHANPDNENPICLKIDLSAGHFSASDRYKYLRELAIDYSFLLDQLGLAEA